jgi:squamous cell carcinoma antigen recognized by T-cells 3
MLSRSIRIKQVPDGTQEPILQQALEKIAPVSKVHLLPDENAAVVELAHVAVSI